jgi:hypothetical protein
LKPGMWPGPEQDPYAHPPGTPHPQAGQMPHRFERQMSAPQPAASTEEQFNMPPTSDRPETSSAMDQFPQPPGAPHNRMQRPPMQRMSSMPGGEGHMLPGQQFRHPFRPPHPSMMRPPGMPPEMFQGGQRPRMEMPHHPGMRLPPETSAVSIIIIF